MKTLAKTLICCAPSIFAVSADAAAEISSQTVAALPSHYHLGPGDCRPGIGFSFVAETPDHPSTYPKLVLRVFNGQIIGMVFEAEAAAGWKPWYDQPEGKPVSHHGGPPHYSQAIYFKAPPTTADCANATGPGKTMGARSER